MVKQELQQCELVLFEPIEKYGKAIDQSSDH